MKRSKQAQVAALALRLHEICKGATGGYYPVFAFSDDVEGNGRIWDQLTPEDLFRYLNAARESFAEDDEQAADAAFQVRNWHRLVGNFDEAAEFLWLMGLRDE